MQEALNNIHNWAQGNDLEINKSKTKIMKFARRDVDTPTTYEIDIVALEQVTNFRYLGVLIDQKLLFNEHVTDVEPWGM